MARRNKTATYDDDFLKKHGTDRYRLSKNWLDTKIAPDWAASNDQYDSVFTASEKKNSDVLLGQGRLFIPKTYSHVQRMLLEVMEEYFFDPEEMVSVIAGKDMIDEQGEIVKAILNYRLSGKPINFFQEAYEFALDAIRNKIGIFKVYPELIQYKTVKQGPSGENTDSEETHFTPHIDCLPFEDVFFDIQATWKDYWKFTIVHRMLKSRDYLKKQGYRNIDEVPRVSLNIPGQDQIKSQRALDQGTDAGTIIDDEKLGDIQNVVVYDIWTYLDCDGDGLLESCNYLMAGDFGGPMVVIRDVEINDLPYHDKRPPFVVGSAFPESHKMYGKDLPNIVRGLQKETNALRNQRREAVAMSLRKPLLVSRNAQIDLTALQNRRIAGVVMGEDISEQGVRELQMTDATLGSAQEQQRTDQDFYETTSITPNSLGMPSNSQETAFATNSHVANANKKINQMIRCLHFTGFLPAFEMLLQLEQEYESDVFIQKVMGEKLGMKLIPGGVAPRDFILGSFGITIGMGKSKSEQTQTIIQLMQQANMANTTQAQLVQLQIVQPGEAEFFNVMKLFKEILPVLGHKNVDQFMLKSQPPPPPPVSQPGTPEVPGVASQPMPPGAPMISNNQHGAMPAMAMNGNGAIH